MAKRQIVTIENEVLREKSKNVTVFDEKLHTLMDDMIETMHAVNGVGLAAPQVGMLKRVVVICTDGEEVIELVNPVIVKMAGSHVELEGCLSIPNKSGHVSRPKKVVVEAQDRHGNLFQLTAKDYLTCAAICHEVDHLDGVLFIDKVIENYNSKKSEHKS